MLPARLAGVVGRAVDTALDRTVVPGFSKIGYTIRSGGWSDPVSGALAGKVVAITGANAGLGKAIAMGAALLGAEVRMLCRDLDRARSARSEILERLPSANLVIDVCDVSSLASIRVATDRITAQVGSLHGLVHNAGTLPPSRSETADGHELTLATHVLGPHLLTTALRPLLAADGDARLIFVSSGGMYSQRLRLGDLEYRHGQYRGTTAYARTKRMQVVLAEQWATRLEADHVLVASMHPGWAATDGVSDSLPGFEKVMRPLLRTPEQGADTSLWLLAAARSQLTTGLFWHDRRPRPTSYLRATRTSPEQAEELWGFCVEAIGS